MFFETPSPRYFAPVRHNSLNAEGVMVVHEFDIECKRFTKSELEALDKRRKAKRMTDAQLAEEIITSFRMKVGDEIKVKPFDRAELAATEEVQLGFTSACIYAWGASISPSEAAHHATKN